MLDHVTFVQDLTATPSPNKSKTVNDRNRQNHEINDDRDSITDDDRGSVEMNEESVRTSSSDTSRRKGSKGSSLGKHDADDITALGNLISVMDVEHQETPTPARTPDHGAQSRVDSREIEEQSLVQCLGAIFWERLRF